MVVRQEVARPVPEGDEQIAYRGNAENVHLAVSEMDG
jgi:hypothetical protein